jgi:lysozyme
VVACVRKAGVLMGYKDICRAQLAVDEGDRLKPYRCSDGKLSIGIGRNLDDNGIRPDERDLMFSNDLNEADITARTLVPSFAQLSDNRRAALVNMSFNMGQQRLSGFKNMLAAVASGDFNRAADEMLSSKWATQVGQRAVRLAQMMREG